MTLTAKQLQAALAGIPVTTQLPPPFEVLLHDGYSVAGGASGDGQTRYAASRLDRAGVAMVTGLKRSDGADVPVGGTAAGAYDMTVAGSGYGPAVATTNLPMCLYVSAALRYRRQRSGLQNPSLITTYNGVSGQSVLEFDADPATGTLGNLIHTKRGYWLSEAQRVAGPLSVRWAGMSVGGMDADMVAGAFYSAATQMWSDWLGQIFAITGMTPRPWHTQTARPVNKPLPAYHVCTEQVSAVEALGGLCPAPWYPILIGDNNIHPNDPGYREMADIIAWVLAECEAGREPPALRPTPTLIGSQLILTYPTRPGVSLALADAAKYASYGGVSNAGFEVTGATISAVTLGGDGASVVIDCTAAPTAWAYAYQAQDVSSYSPNAADNYGAHRGLLHTTETAAGYLTSTPIRRWALSWRGSL